MKKLGRLAIDKTIFFNCDIQSGFAKLVPGIESVTTVSRQMGQTSKILGIPMLVTEQNSKVFGHTLEEIKNDIPQDLSFWHEKTTFSMINEETQKFLSAHEQRKSVVLYGLEAHVCVQQTCLDLIDMGYDVHLLVDGISSIKSIDRKAGIRRMEQQGAYITSAQSVIFELIKLILIFPLNHFCQFQNYLEMIWNNYKIFEEKKKEMNE